MQPEIEIFPLSACPHLAPILAHWSHTEWYLNRDISFDMNLKSYRARAMSRVIPLSFAALHRGIPAGMVSLKTNDLWSRKDLNPWLASLYVHPKFRRMGIGTRLVETAELYAGESGHTRIFLFVSGPDSAMLSNFYSSLGWSTLERCLDNDGNDALIFKKDISGIKA